MRTRNNPRRRIERLHGMLMSIIDETECDLAVLRSSMRESGTERRAVGDVTDDITSEADLATVAARAEVLTARHKAAADALRRLSADAGAYGVCIDCGNDISEARLAALPFATRCIICQDSAESLTPLSRRQTGAFYEP